MDSGMSASDDFDRMILEFMQDDPQTATYHQYLSGVYNPATSEYTTTQVDTQVQCIVQDFDRLNAGFSSKFNTLIEAGDREMYMRPTEKVNHLATPIVPNPTKDRVTVNGITYKIEIVKVADPGNVPLVYNFLLRR